jgi:glycosyltransferase involved in cell wall biosynthesis
MTDTAVRDAQTELLLPEHDADDPELSIVIPALNEGLTITDFVRWCHEGMAEAGVVGEILIVDSSTDDTPALAVAEGARVLRVPKRGLGRAYMDAIPYIRGKWVLMGDADCTYDFRRLAPFVESFRAGHEYVMGSRWKGSIEPGAMPRLHQYFGTPLTTWILNRLYSSRFSDIHCGMRGITLDALERMHLQSESWEYASEMVLKSVHMDLRTAEVPVTFLKDREGRLSHHKRSGWFSPWHAAWINLRAMFVYGSDFFVLRPGLLLLALGVLLTVPLAGGPIELGQFTLSLYTMLLGLSLTIVGLQSFCLGCIAQVLFDYTGRAKRRWTRLFPYTRTVATAWGLIALGVVLAVPLVVRYLSNDFELGAPSDVESHLAVLGLTVAISGFQLFTFTLLLHGTVLATTRRRP